MKHLIQDTTNIPVNSIYDKKNDPRPALLTDEYYLIAGRALYNLAWYKQARECFEEGLKQTSMNWHREPACYYFYHYLKTIHALGSHDEAIERAQEILSNNKNISTTIKASLLTSAGLGHWKLGEYQNAIAQLGHAKTIYEYLAETNTKNLIDLLDVITLRGIVHLDQYRKDGKNNALSFLRNTITDITEVIEKCKRASGEDINNESHYTGRLRGFLAFTELLEIEQSTDDKNADSWDKAVGYSEEAFGGQTNKDRNPMGILSGKYCAAAVYLHKSEHCIQNDDQIDATKNAAKCFLEAASSYKRIYGEDVTIHRTGAKMCKLHKELIERVKSHNLPDLERKLSEIEEFSKFLESLENVEIFSPIH